MKKLQLLIVLVVLWAIKANGQCGVISGFQPTANSSNIGSTLDADVNLTIGWNIYAYEWTRNGSAAGTTASIPNQGVGYDNVCLKVKATNPVTSDSCESEYCQLVYTVYPSVLDLYIDVAPAGTKTLQIFGGVCTSYPVPNPFVELDYGDGIVEYVNNATHTFPDTGIYEIKFTYDDGVSFPQFVKRKVYVDNGHVNFDVAGIVGTSSCFTVNSAFSSSPQFFSGNATSVFPSPLCMTNFVPVSWATSFPMNYYGTGVDIIKYSATDSLGNDIGTCRLVAVPDCKIAPDTMSGTVWLDTDADGLFDPGESGYSGPGNISNVLGPYEAPIGALGNYNMPVPQTPSNIYVSPPSNYIVTYPGSSGYAANFNTSSNHPGYNFGITEKGATICGQAFVDVNGNNVYDSGTDFYSSFVTITAFNTVLGQSFSSYTNQSGNYCISAPVGSYIVTATCNGLDSAFSVPDSIILSAPTVGNYLNNNFAIQTPVQGGNLGVFLNAGGMPRPGFSYSLNSTISNTGNMNSSGTVVLNYDPALTYVNSTSGGVHNATNKTVTWQTGIMAPTTSKYYNANFTVPVATPLGTMLNSNATVTTVNPYTDYNLTNNFASVSSTVIGSFDPNDKLVTPAGIGASGNVLHTQRLYYRINFQNTGTASAINIIVQDSIDSNLNIGTFRMERASHNYITTITGNTITWKFYNINLPDSNTNEPQSHGFIEYSIIPVQGLPDGTVISNDADIYFDFNPPIVTNTVSNTLQTTLSSVNQLENGGSFAVYPNPFRNEIVIKQLNINEPVSRVSLYDVYGKMIVNQEQNEGSDNIYRLNVTNISDGVYILRIENKSGSYIMKLLRQ